MQRLGFTGRLSAWSARNHWLTIGLWIAGAVAILGLAGVMGSRLTTDITFSNTPDSQIARELLEEARGGEEPYFEQIIVHSDEHTVDDPEFAAFAAELQAAVRALDGVVDPQQSFSYFETGEEGLVSASRHTTLIPTLLIGRLDEATENVVQLEETLDEFDGRGFLVVTGGYASVNQAFGEASESDLGTEFKVMPVAFLILIVVIGAVVAAFLPIGLAIFAIMITTGLIGLMSQAYEMSIFVTNVMIMIGLAVGIDYALLIIARYREERRHGRAPIDAIGVSGDTAARAVVFSGLTVVIALTGMFVVPTSIFRSFAIGASAVVLVTIVASVTLLPALLSLLGDRVNGLSIPFFGGKHAEDEEHGVWASTARFVMKNAPVMATATAALLVVMAVPYFSIKLGASGTESLPESFEARQAFDILDREFNAGRLQSTDIVVQADDINAAPVQDALGRFIAAIQADPTYSLISGVQVLRDDLALVQIAVPGEAASPEAIDAMKHVRSDIVPQSFAGVAADVYVGGPTAGNSDFFDVVDQYTPWVFAFVLGFSFLLLTLIFRSLVVPVKSIIMNLLSVGAAYGVVVAVFQWGWLADPLGFTQVEDIEAWLPLFMFTILFGLSMDYHIFLLSRIRERYDETHSNTESVAFGLRRTANIITGAAAIMVAVFSGFALGDLPMFQQIGVGLAAAVFLDATVVRTVLVPATMRMLGDWNWYMPSWLSWLPDLRVEREPGGHVASGVPGGH